MTGAFLQQFIQRKLSAVLGADVTFDKLSVSLLGGTIEAAGVTVSGGDKSLPPILTIAKLRAEVAVARALKGEIAVRSLAVERPVLHFVRRDGRTNFPSRPATAERQEVRADDKEDKTSWRLDVERVLVVDGEATADLDGRLLFAKPVLAELKRVGGDAYELTLLSDSVSHLGSVRGSGRITGAPDLSSLPNAALSAELQLGEIGQVKFVTPRIRSRNEGEISVHGGISVAKLMSLLKG